MHLSRQTSWSFQSPGLPCVTRSSSRVNPLAARSLLGAKVGVAGIPVSRNKGAELSLQGGGMAWIKETKKQGAVSKNKTLRFPFRRLQCGERAWRCSGLRFGGQPRQLTPYSPCRGIPWPPVGSFRAPLDGWGKPPGKPTERTIESISPRGLRCPQLRSLSGAMRASITSLCSGRILRMRWKSFLPFVVALLMRTGHAQRDSVGRYEPASRDANRLWRPVGSHPVAAAAKVYSLFREPDAPVSGLSPSEWNQPGQRGPRRPAEAEAEARRPSRAQQLRRAQPPVQTRRSSPRSQPHPAARAAPSVARPVTPQRPAAARQGRLTG